MSSASDPRGGLFIVIDGVPRHVHDLSVAELDRLGIPDEHRKPVAAAPATPVTEEDPDDGR